MENTPQVTTVTSQTTNLEANPANPSKSLDATKVTEPATLPEIDPKTFKRRIKIDGKESEVTLEELERGYQLRKVSDERMMTAEAMKRQAVEVVKLLKENPRQVLKMKELGFTKEQIRQWAEEEIAEQANEEMMTPEQRELAELRQQRDSWKSEQEAKQKEIQDAQILSEQKKYADEYTKEIISVVEKSALPKTPYMVSRVARIMAASLDTDHPLTAEDAVPLIREHYQQDLSHFVKELDGKSILEFLGPEIVDKIRRYDLDLKKTPLDNLKKPEVQAQSVSEEERLKVRNEKKISSTEWRKRFS